MTAKRLLYLAWSKAIRQWWQVRGGRRVRLFGQDCLFSPSTELACFRRMALPVGGWQSRIVRYTDYVQAHALCSALDACGTCPTIVDVGAHHGAYAVWLGLMAQQRQGTLLAIEPDPTNFGVLRDNVARNGLEQVVKCEQVGVAEDSGTLRLQSFGSQSTVGGAFSEASGPPVDVKVEPLASLIAKHKLGRVDLLLVDVEGAELQVLRSFPWESAVCGSIFCEMHPYNWDALGYASWDMDRLLKERSLRCFDMYFREYPPFPADRHYLGPCRLVHA